MPSLRRSEGARASRRAATAARRLFGRGGRLAGGGERLVRGCLFGAGRLEAVLQLGVTGVQVLDLGAQFLVLGLRGLGAVAGLVAGGGQPADLGLGGGGPGAGGVDLAVEAGQALAAVGDGAGGGLEAALLLGEPPFELRAVADGVVQGPLGGVQRLGQLRLLLADTGGLAFHVLRVAAPAVLDGLGGGVPVALFGQADGAADPFGELGEAVPGGLGLGEPRRQGPYLLFEAGLAPERRRQFGLDGGPALLERGLVGDLGAQGLAQGDQVVGEQPQPGVAQIGLDDGGPAGDLGLAGRAV